MTENILWPLRYFIALETVAELIPKDYSEYVDIIKFKDKNPNKTDRSPFSKEEIDALWLQENNLYAQIVLMLIYSGVCVRAA